MKYYSFQQNRFKLFDFEKDALSMLQHYDFIPFKTSSLPKGISLIFAPHPDDETFGVGGSILQLTNNRQKVHLVVMTNGALGGDIAKREKELLEVKSLLGIEKVHFFGAQDGALDVDYKNIKKIILLLKNYKPDNVFFPSPFEYHPDHRATAWLVWNALQNISFPGKVFSYEIANQSPINILIDISQQMQEKQKLMKLYVSQNEQLDYMSIITALNKSRAYTLSPSGVKYAEGLFAFPDLSMDLMSYYYQNFNSYHRGMKVEKLPLISVLIRTKNRPEQLHLALESIIKQTYQQLEINIVNDGGVDIQYIIDKFDFECVNITNHKISKGRAVAANALLQMIHGEYAIFLDDDDTFDSDHIENLVRVVQKNENIHVVYSGVRVNNGIDTIVFNEPYNALLLMRGNYIPIHATLFSSKLLKKGYRFDESLEIYEDWDFWLQLAQYTEFYHLDKITATYNINGESGVNGTRGNAAIDVDIDMATKKILEKWLPKWSASQLYETYIEIDRPYREKIKSLQKEIMALQKKLNHIEIKNTSNKRVFSSINIGEFKFYPLPIENQKILIDRLKIAVVMHVFYIDLFEEMMFYVKNIQYEISLFITVHTEEDSNIVKIYLNEKKYKNFTIRLVPNRGRDVAPFLIEYSQDIKKFDLCCKIHSKKSPHQIYKNRSWREHLYYNLLGSEEITKDIIKAFSTNEHLGLLFSDNYGFVDFSCFAWMENKNMAQNTLKKLKLEAILPMLDEEYIDFPAGTMFWFRPKALSPLLDASFSYDDFPKEPIAPDGTRAHALERLFAYIVRYEGYDFIEQNWKHMYYTKNTTHKNFHQKLKLLEQTENTNKNLNTLIDLLLKERIEEYDEKKFPERAFELTSNRNYLWQCIELFEEVFKEKMTREFWNWKYASDGMKWRGICAVKNGKVIGHYGGMSRNIAYFGESKKALEATDIMVSPKFRGGIKQNSPFYIMAHTWINMNLGAKKEFLFAYGFPNKRHMLLSEKIGLYKEVDTITEILWQIQGDSISQTTTIEKYIPNKKNDMEMQTIWENMALEFEKSIIVIRDVPYLKNRYLNHPKFTYLPYLQRDKNGKLLSVFILKKEKQTMLLMDIIAKQENFKLAIQDAINIAQKNNCKILKCWITTSKANLFMHLNATSSLADISIPTSNITKDFNPEQIKDRWFLMYGDTDFI